MFAENPADSMAATVLIGGTEVIETESGKKAVSQLRRTVANGLAGKGLRPILSEGPG